MKYRFKLQWKIGFRIASILVTFLAGFVFANATTGAIIYYDGFDYGDVDGFLAGKNGGIGFSGPWLAGNPVITYAAAGMTFSDLLVVGGRITATGIDGIGNASNTRPLIAMLDGVYFGSFLTQVVDTSSDSGIFNGMSVGPPNTFFGSSNLAILAPQNTDALTVYSGFEFMSGGIPLSVGQTYLVLFLIDTDAFTVKGWVLSAAQFDTFKPEGLTEAELDAAAVGVEPSQIWGRATVTAHTATITASYLNVFMNANSGGSTTLAEDEFRLSDTSLDEVTPKDASGTWKPNPATGDWNTPTNWLSGVVPDSPFSVATFDASSISSVSLSAPIEIDSIVFDSGASAYTITVSPTKSLTIDGEVLNDSGLSQQFVIAASKGDGPGALSFDMTASVGTTTTFTNNAAVVIGTAGGSTTFSGSANAGTASFTNGAAAGVTFHDTSSAASGSFINNGARASGQSGGFVLMEDSASAGSATFTNNAGSVSGAGGGLTNLFGSANAGNATFIARGGAGVGGSILFSGKSSGGTARIEVFGNGSIDLSNHSSPGVTIGSIEGDGSVLLGATTLSTGSNNLNTTFAGVISGRAGALKKTGAGTFILSGANTYPGGTTVSAGTLAITTRPAPPLGLARLWCRLEH
ncbi:MAG: autotransporter-associated beta strand repeat-containing protein [Chthoniobacterales bacterium]|nr:autotransporter-associated beta strand repeat-containing protein [Chthoniobacterales bacterium]